MTQLEVGGGFRTMVRASWASRHPRASHRELFSRIRDHLNRKPGNAKAFIQNLHQDAEEFARLVRPNSRDRNAFSLASLESIGLRQQMPFLLACRRQLKDTDFTRALTIVEAITCRYLIAGEGNPNQLEEFYVSSSHLVGKTGASALGDVQETAIRDRLYSSDEDFMRDFCQIECSKPSTARYLLSRLERELSGKERPPAASDDVHVEHILPQAPTDRYWKAHFPTEDIAALYVNRLGNLTLLADDLNEGASNSPFPKKVETYYARSDLRLNKLVSKVGDWTSTAIEERQKELAKLAVKIWRFQR